MRLNTNLIGEFIRVLLLMLAVIAPLIGLWPAIGGMTGVYGMTAENTTVHKDAGVTTAPWPTEDFPSISWIKVTVTATREVDVRIIAMNNREIQVHNASGFAVEEDRTVVAGGGANNGQGIGRDVTLTGSHGGPGRYLIIVTASQDTQAANFTDRDIEYTLVWQVHKLDPTVFLMGLVVFSMVFITEYVLVVRRDMKAMSRKLDKFIAEGGAPARAPSAALGVATPPSFGPPPTAAADVAPSREEPPRRGFFGSRGSTASAQVPAYDEQPAEEVYPPPPAIAMEPPAPRAPPAPPQPTAYGAPTGRYGAPPPPQPMYGEPESFVPSAPAPPPMRAQQAPPRMAQAPPPAPAAPPAQQQGPEPVTKVRCPQCKHIVPVFTAERPTPIKCPNCGKRGMLPR